MTEKRLFPMNKEQAMNVAEAATWLIPGILVPKVVYRAWKGVNLYKKVLQGSRSSTNMLINQTWKNADKQIKDIGKMATKNVNKFLKIKNPTSYELSVYKSSQKVLNTSKKDLLKLTKTNIDNLNKGLVDTKTLLKKTLLKENAGGVAGDAIGATGAYLYLTKNRSK